jgi:hypothetical protein
LTSHIPTEDDPNTASTFRADGAPEPEERDKPSEIKRELTGEEIAAVFGGGVAPKLPPYV